MLLVLVLLLVFCGNVWAKENVNNTDYKLEKGIDLLPEKINSDSFKLIEGKVYGYQLSDDYFMLETGQIIPMSEIDDYKTEFSAYKYITTPSAYVSNQPSRGFYFDKTGGSINISLESGSTVSVYVSFGGKFGSMNVGFPVGSVTSVSGVSVNIPANAYYKVKSQKDYKTRKYITYKRVWVSDFSGYQWQEWSGGVQKELLSYKFIPVRQ